MYQLTMYAQFEPLSRIPDRVIVDPVEYDTSPQAELRALRWLHYCPNDIVMLEDDVADSNNIEQILCEHCNEPVTYKPSLYSARWIHTAGYFACLPRGETRAEPQNPYHERM